MPCLEATAALRATLSPEILTARATIAEMRSMAVDYRRVVEEARSAIEAARVLMSEMDSMLRAPAHLVPELISIKLGS